MALPLAHPDRIELRVAGRTRSLDFNSPRLAIRTVVGVVARGLAIGVGLGLLLIAGPGASSLIAAGVLALGAALLSWDP
jgi:hypothetical protein